MNRYQAISRRLLEGQPGQRRRRRGAYWRRQQPLFARGWLKSPPDMGTPGRGFEPGR